MKYFRIWAAAWVVLHIIDAVITWFMVHDAGALEMNPFEDFFLNSGLLGFTLYNGLICIPIVYLLNKVKAHIPWLIKLIVLLYSILIFYELIAVVYFYL